MHWKLNYAMFEFEVPFAVKFFAPLESDAVSALILELQLHTSGLIPKAVGIAAPSHRPHFNTFVSILRDNSVHTLEASQILIVMSSNPELTPQIVDRLARTTPDALYAEYPNSPQTYAEGYRKITYRDFANAVNGLAWWLRESLGPGDGSQVLAYIGPNDLRYPALILGAVKAGYVIFLTSPRNSVAAQKELFQRLKCMTLLFPNPRPPPVFSIAEALPVKALEVPDLDELLGKEHPHFGFKKTFGDARDEPLFVVHTSGSTGVPKPIVFTHDTAARNTRLMAMQPPPGFMAQEDIYRGKRVLMTFPPFHAAYLAVHFFLAIHSGTVIVSPISGAIPSAEGLVEGLKKSPANVAYIVPSIVQELSQAPALLDYCAQNLDALIYCGGDLPQSMGDIVASKIRLVNQFGATELGLQSLLQPAGGPHDPEDWKYVQFHPDIGVDMRHVTGDVHELCMVRDPKIESLHQPTFTLFPDAQEYASRDLFIRHPDKTKSDLWRWHARADDIIVFLNGEKTNPISMEQQILFQNSNIGAVLVVGSQRFQAALLIEPAGNVALSTTEKAAFIEEIWASIEDANSEAPAHARIARSHILFTEPGKPMIRAGKGTIQRAGTVQLYANEIEKLYADAEKLSDDLSDGARPFISFDDTSELAKIIGNTVQSTTGWSSLEYDTDMFELGMDSLQALMTVRSLKHVLGLSELGPSNLYANPSVAALTLAVLKIAKKTKKSEKADKETQLLLIQTMISEYKDMIDQIPVVQANSTKPAKETVLLTGSTGALGSYLLDTLLANPRIAHIFCLNRSADSLKLQSQRNLSRNLSTTFDPSRVTFLHVDLSEKSLGLDQPTLEKLSAQTTLIIHNAWPVNFNLSLPSFTPSLKSLINLLTLTASSPLHPQFFFISSISSVLSHTSSSLIPESIIHSPSAPAPNGYAQSKYIAEQILFSAAARLSLPISLARVGQIAGAVQRSGSWNRDEWFPSLVISSTHIGAVPEDIGGGLLGGEIDWVPIDLLSGVLVDLALGMGPRAEEGAVQVFHPKHPKPISWAELRDVVVGELALISGKEIEKIPLKEWIARVRDDIEGAAGRGRKLGDGEMEDLLRANPAVKLLDFYEGLLGTGQEGPNKLAGEKTLQASARLEALEGIKEEWIRKWVREWFEV
ncbi:NRPS-like enzyme protein [Rutstroemia sp. NJR-2017a WRK4]|nr:NRPS-like enzyme protein [Rutstroemia sp. NJR-2017a WRK4]